jgi:hypothetical protein
VVAGDALRRLAIPILVSVQLEEHVDFSSVNDAEVFGLVGPGNLVDLLRFLVGRR